MCEFDLGDIKVKLLQNQAVFYG